jgi:hypothetical protein
MPRRSLYQCAHARVEGSSIRCGRGHCLDVRSVDGGVSARRLAVGAPLELAVCRRCPDFDSMGPPVAREERGWLRRKSRVRNPYGRKGKPLSDG